MTTYFLDSLLVIFHLPANAPAADSLADGLSREQQRLWILLYPVLAVLLLLAAAALFRYILLRRSRLKRWQQMAAHNHPAIPAIVYEIPQRPYAPEAFKQTEPETAQQEAPPDSPPADEQEPDPDDYDFYSQLDRLEED